jgi:hypothetical protein
MRRACARLARWRESLERPPRCKLLGDATDPPHPRNECVYDVADACRTALVEFLALDPRDTRGLYWFSGPLPPRRELRGPAIRFVRPSCRRAAQADSRTRVGRTIHTPGRDDRSKEARRGATRRDVAGGRRRHCRRCVFGGHGFAPLNQAHAPLVNRVLTLLVADYLTRPDDYLARNGHAFGPHPLAAAGLVDLRLTMVH